MRRRSPRQRRPAEREETGPTTNVTKGSSRDRSSLNCAVRGLTPADVEPADVVLKAAYGGRESRAETLRRFLTLDAGGWRVAVDGNTILGCVGALDYGRFAYVGMMAVRPDAQGRGIGRALMQDVLAWIGDRGTASVLLDATAAGAPLYTSLGFEDEDDVCLYTRAEAAGPTARPDSAITLGADDVQPIGRLDTPIFGADRQRLLGLWLAAFPGRAFGTRDRAASSRASPSRRRIASVRGWHAAPRAPKCSSSPRCRCASRTRPASFRPTPTGPHVRCWRSTGSRRAAARATCGEAPACRGSARQSGDRSTTLRDEVIAVGSRSILGVTASRASGGGLHERPRELEPARVRGWDGPGGHGGAPRTPTRTCRCRAAAGDGDTQAGQDPQRVSGPAVRRRRAAAG